jgi:hypothetical protein
VDTSVAAAVITSGAALVVAIGGGVRSELRAAADRRYDRRRAFLTDAQDAALALRDALRDYGAALRALAAAPSSGQGGAFTLAVPPRLDAEVSLAEGRFVVARSRLDDDAVAESLSRWRSVARVSLIDQSEAPAAAEQRAFDEMNDLIGAALRSARGRAGRRSGGDG